MRLARSFRFRLAVQFSALLILSVAVLGGSAFLALRHVIGKQVDETLLRLAEIEAAATSDAPDSLAHFHDNVFHSSSSEVSQEVSRYAEIWSYAGVPLARSQNLADRDLRLPPDARLAAAKGEQAWFTYEDSLGTLRSLVYPFSHADTQRSGQILQVAAPIDRNQETLLEFLRILGLIGLAGAAVSFGGAWYFAGRSIAPVKQIADQASRLEPGRSAGNIVVRADSAEHRRLVAVLNEAFDRLLSAVQAQRRFTADASHEFRTPLAIIQGDIEVALRRDRSPVEYRELLGSTLEEARRLIRIADDLLTLARSDSGVLPVEHEPLDIASIVTDLVKRYRSLGDGRVIELERVPADGPATVAGDEGWIRQAVGNVLENAFRYAGEGGHIRVSVRRIERADGTAIRIEVEDDGPGIAKDDVPRIFQRFFRADRARRKHGGTGLGLPIAKAILEAHGGSIEVRSQPGVGTTMVLNLPAT
jgi:signal transduction histidine kinase